jgi:hypothetical protein
MVSRRRFSRELRREQIRAIDNESRLQVVVSQDVTKFVSRGGLMRDRARRGRSRSRSRRRFLRAIEMGNRENNSWRRVVRVARHARRTMANGDSRLLILLCDVVHAARTNC